jgi:hypothetical protein
MRSRVLRDYSPDGKPYLGALGIQVPETRGGSAVSATCGGIGTPEEKFLEFREGMFWGKVSPAFAEFPSLEKQPAQWRVGALCPRHWRLELSDLSKAVFWAFPAPAFDDPNLELKNYEGG